MKEVILTETKVDACLSAMCLLSGHAGNAWHLFRLHGNMVFKVIGKKRRQNMQAGGGGEGKKMQNALCFTSHYGSCLSTTVRGNAGRI